MSLQGGGFDYKLICRILFSGEYIKSEIQTVQSSDGEGLILIAQGVARGNSKTEGYHERRVPISSKVRKLLMKTSEDAKLVQMATLHVDAIAGVRKLLWVALAVLFANGHSGDSSEGNKLKATLFSAPFERAEDARFFDDLNEEIDATDPTVQRLQWMFGLVARAEAILKQAFDAGPRNGVQKYRAQSAALSRFRGALRGENSPLPDLAHYYRQQTNQRQEESLDHA